MFLIDFLDEDRIDEFDGFRRSLERRKYLDRSWFGRGEGEQKSNGKENRGVFRVIFDVEIMNKDFLLLRLVREDVDRIKFDKGLSSGGKGCEKQEFKSLK